TNSGHINNPTELYSEFRFPKTILKHVSEQKRQLENALKGAQE
ncbi:Unannotated, partial [Lentimonas sp. CC19]